MDHSSELVAFARWQQGAGFVVPCTTACFILKLPPQPVTLGLVLGLNLKKGQNFWPRSWQPRATTRWPQSRKKKFSEFSRLSRAINLLFHRLSQQKVNVINNDLHQGSFHINSSNITGHHCTLTRVATP